MKNAKQERQEKIKSIKAQIKQKLKSSQGKLSEINSDGIGNGSDFDKQIVESLFPEQKEKFINNEIKKAETQVKIIKASLGSHAYKLQVDFISNNPKCKHQLSQFDEQTAMNIYKSVI